MMLTTGVAVLATGALLMPLPTAWGPMNGGVGVPSQPGGAAVMAARQKPARGTVRITVQGSGSYTIIGRGQRRTGSSSRTYKVKPGRYTVAAAFATVTPATVRVRQRQTARVTVAFHADGDPATDGGPRFDNDVVLPVMPQPVTRLQAGEITPTTITLSWTNPSDPDLAEVIVRRADGEDAPLSPTAGSAVALPSLTATSVTDLGLTPATTYSYAVFTRNTSGNIALGYEAMITTATTATPL